MNHNAKDQLLEVIVPTWHFLDAKDITGKNILISFRDDLQDEVFELATIPSFTLAVH